MSATAVRPAYVPRTGSLPPGSPKNGSSSASGAASLPKRPAFVPRTPNYSVGSPSGVSEEVKRSADAILKLFSGLPAPIAGSPLPPKLLAKQSPRTSPSSLSSASAAGSSSYSSFKAYARAQKRKLSDEDLNGLGLSMSGKSSRPPLKKSRTSENMPGSGTSTPSAPVTPPLRSSHAPSSPKNRSSLRNEITRGESKADWTPEQWATLADDVGKRAHALKRLGDAYINPAGAKGHLKGAVSQDKLRGVLYLTDSLCLYLYKNFADERAKNHQVSTTAYQQLKGLREFVLGRWNDHASGEHKDLVRGMIGLIYLMAAISSDVVARTDMRSLNKMSTDALNPAGGGGAHGPSPSSSSASPGVVGRSPASSSQSELPSDVLKLVGMTYAAAGRSHKALAQSRSYLPPRMLRQKFPETYERALASDLADDAVPSDPLGSARSVDIDDPDHFAWPIELGMQHGVAHVAVFGRALIREFAHATGKPWEPVLSEAESPDAR